MSQVQFLRQQLNDRLEALHATRSRAIAAALIRDLRYLMHRQYVRQLIAICQLKLDK